MLLIYCSVAVLSISLMILKRHPDALKEFSSSIKRKFSKSTQLIVDNFILEELILSHSTVDKIDFDLSFYENRLLEKNKTIELSLPYEEEFEILHNLSKFELGRFLLHNKGFNGNWTAYLIIHGPKRNRLELNPIEDFILNEAPIAKSTQDRFAIFQKQIQSSLRNNMKLASLPCGMMDDLLSLNYSSFKGVSLTGIDIDPISLKLSRQNALKYNNKNVNYLQRNAWNMSLHNQFDLITSNGLNIYEPDNERVLGLYKEMYQSLKKNGILITSALTPPPSLSAESTWKNYKIENIIKSKALFNDIIEANWQSYVSEKDFKDILEKVGFSVKEVIYDSLGIFPTYVAIK